MHEEIKSDLENKYLRRFEIEFRAIVDEINTLSNALPQYKDENASLRERIDNIRCWTNVASKKRYNKDADPDAILANLITHVLTETDNVDALKPTIKEPDTKIISDDLFKMLSHSQNINLEEAMRGFDFYDNNPYKTKAEKRIAKIKKRNKK